MLMLRDLVAGYGGRPALHGVSMTAADASITAVAGRSGAGKTALASAIGGLLPVISGQMLFAGYDITRMAAKERFELGIRFVPSGRQLFAGMTLLENLQLGAELPPREFAHGLDFVLSLFPELQALLGKPAAALPNEIHRFAILARALISAPKLLVLDQPSLGLNGKGTLSLYQAISHASLECGIAVLLTEQKLFQALRLAETVYRIDKGRIDSQHTALDMLSDRRIQAEFPGSEVCAA
jgi:branched-chain amino acid transport system ATP-binding protein